MVELLHHGEGQPSDLITPHERYLQLDQNPAGRQNAYRRLMAIPISAEVLSRIRTAIHRNRPLGDDTFVQQVDAAAQNSLVPLSHTCPGTCPVPGPGLGGAAARRSS
jgi:hypothetical protein